MPVGHTETTDKPVTVSTNIHKEEVEITDEANTTDDSNEESEVEAPKADDSEIFPELDSKAPAETAEVVEKDNQETIDLSELKN